ncbi:hypothetical protein VTO42DRAFT_5257 [Malbranchea cinnamomea]
MLPVDSTSRHREHAQGTHSGLQGRCGSIYLTTAGTTSVVAALQVCKLLLCPKTDWETGDPGRMVDFPAPFLGLEDDDQFSQHLLVSRKYKRKSFHSRRMWPSRTSWTHSLHTLLAWACQSVMWLCCPAALQLSPTQVY